MRALAKLGFNQSYTYFTWKNTKAQLTEYLTELTQSEMREYYRPNFFANTPDILHEYLQKGGRPAFRVRLVLAGTLAPVYGIYSGYELCENTPVREGSEEYLNSEKYEIRTRDWRALGNIRDDVARLNLIRRENPALHSSSNLQFLTTESEQIIAYRRFQADNELIVVVNLDPTRVQETIVHLPLTELGIQADEPFEVTDLLVGTSYTWRSARNYVRLDPQDKVAHVFRINR
jgi:starch synthase (maltosyl-transferring)